MALRNLVHFPGSGPEHFWRITGCIDRWIKNHGLTMPSEQLDLKKNPLGHTDGQQEGQAKSWCIPHSDWQGEWQPHQLHSHSGRTGSSNLPAFPDLSVCPRQTLPLIGEAESGYQGVLLIGVSLLSCQPEEDGGNIEFIRHVDRGQGVGEGTPECRRKCHVGQSCEKQLVWPWAGWPSEPD